MFFYVARYEFLQWLVLAFCHKIWAGDGDLLTLLAVLCEYICGIGVLLGGGENTSTLHTVIKLVWTFCTKSWWSPKRLVRRVHRLVRRVHRQVRRVHRLVRRVYKLVRRVHKLVRRVDRPLRRVHRLMRRVWWLLTMVQKLLERVQMVMRWMHRSVRRVHSWSEGCTGWYRPLWLVCRLLTRVQKLLERMQRLVRRVQRLRVHLHLATATSLRRRSQI